MVGLWSWQHPRLPLACQNHHPKSTFVSYFWIVGFPVKFSWGKFNFLFFLNKFFSLLLKIIISKPFGNCKVLWSPPQLHTEVASSLKNDKCLWFSQYWETAHFWPEVSIFFRRTRMMEYLWQCSKLGHPSSLIFWMWQERVKSFLLSALQTPDLVCSLLFYPLLPWLIHLMSSTLNL